MMLTRIFQSLSWRQKSQRVGLDVAYARGYDYAAGALLRGEETVESLQAKVFSPFPQSASSDQFDRGVRDAIARLVRDGAVEDNSI